MAGAHDDWMISTHRVDQADGTWWELGWNQRLGTFYGRHFEAGPHPDSDTLLAWIGIEPGEVTTVQELTDHTELDLPHATVAQLNADRRAFPFPGLPAAPDNTGTSKPHHHEPAPADSTDAHIGPVTLEVIVTGYQRTGEPTQPHQPPHSSNPQTPTVHQTWSTAPHPSFEQVTRPSIYPFLLITDASPGPGVDLHHASAAYMRVRDPDRGPGTPPAHIDLVRISALSDRGWWGGHDIWLQWQHTTKTWELTDDPRRHHGTIHPGIHTPPEAWTLEHETEAIHHYETESLKQLLDIDVGEDNSLSDSDGLDHGLDLD